LSVAANGEWHQAHAFGDFCEFCHAGNVQATAQEEAHTGMVAPLGDVKASCQGCHPDDYPQLAQTYAATLDVDLAGGSGPGGGDNATLPTGSNTTGGDIAGCTTGTTAVNPPTGGEAIDYNLLYAEATTPPPLISNWGNVILVLLILATAAAFFFTAWGWENWGQSVAGWINRNVAPTPQAVAAASHREGGLDWSGGLVDDNTAQIQTVLAQKPQLRALLPKLLNLSPETLAALDSILANPERGSEVLQAVSQVDSEVIATLRRLGTKDRNLLMTLFKS
jgi:hypothetical protein